MIIVSSYLNTNQTRSNLFNSVIFCLKKPAAKYLNDVKIFDNFSTTFQHSSWNFYHRVDKSWLPLGSDKYFCQEQNKNARHKIVKRSVQKGKISFTKKKQKTLGKNLHFLIFCKIEFTFYDMWCHKWKNLSSNVLK